MVYHGDSRGPRSHDKSELIFVIAWKTSKHHDDQAWCFRKTGNFVLPTHASPCFGVGREPLITQWSHQRIQMTGNS